MSSSIPATGKKLFLLCSMLTGFLNIIPVTSSAAITDNLTAEMITTQFGRQSKALLKIKGDKVRIEVKSGRAFSTVIARYDKNLLWLLHPAAQKYTKMSVDSLDRRIPHFFRPGLKIERSKVSEEKLAGRSAYKYKAEITDPEGNKYSGFIWESPKVDGFPLKWHDPTQGITVEWLGIETDTLPAYLFELPEKYAMIPDENQKKLPPGKHQGQHAEQKSTESVPEETGK